MMHIMEPGAVSRGAFWFFNWNIQKREDTTGLDTLSTFTRSPDVKDFIWISNEPDGATEYRSLIQLGDYILISCDDTTIWRSTISFLRFPFGFTMILRPWVYEATHDTNLLLKVLIKISFVFLRRNEWQFLKMSLTSSIGFGRPVYMGMEDMEEDNEWRHCRLDRFVFTDRVATARDERNGSLRCIKMEVRSMIRELTRRTHMLLGEIKRRIK